MKWISIEDSLPDKQGEIVVLVGGKIFLGYSLPYGTLFLTECKFVYFFSKPSFIPGSDISMTNGSYWSIPSEYKEVTHWMPLPQPPKD